MSAAYYVAAALIAIAGVLTAHRCRQAATPALRAFTATLFILTGAFLLLANASRPAIDDLTGVNTFARWAGNSLTLAAGSGLNITLRCFARRPSDSPPRARGYIIAVTASSVAMAILVLGLPDSDDFIDIYATRLDVTAYLLIYLAGIGAIMSGALLSGARYAARTRGWLRIGMTLVAVGATFGVAYSLYKSAVVVAHHTGHQFGIESIVGPTLGLSSALLITIGSTLGTWAPPITAVIRRTILYRRMEPLHAALSAAFPEIRLGVEGGDYRYRLDRRVVEIRDGQLRLRPWSDHLHSAAAAAGLFDRHHPAAVESLVIAAALKSRSDGAPPTELYPDRSATTDTATSHLETEALHLAQVAKSFASPPTNIQIPEEMVSQP